VTAATPVAARGGIRGIGDRLVGPGATTGEQAVTGAAVCAGVAVALGTALHAQAAWGWWQYAPAALVAADLFGGVAANATDAAKRWWHRPGRTARQHLGFVAAHVQPFALAWLLPGYDWTAAAVTYGLAFIAAVGIVAAPDRLRRPAAFAAGATAVAIVVQLPGVGPELAWFGPVLLVKLLLAHLLPEGANRP
jgi:hypothetical protein